MPSPSLFILGASTRAAAFSALRARLHPRCVDLFADADLRQRCPVQRLTGRYPDDFEPFLDRESAGPWVYTGGLENYPHFVQRMATKRPLWGNGARALSRCRDPHFVASLLRAADLPTPTVARSGERRTSTIRWLRKPLKSAGGSGIRFDVPSDGVQARRGTYWQEYVEGQPQALLFLGAEGLVRLLGMTRQLVGVPWLHAAPFRYCGSIGPLDPNAVRLPSLEELGNLLASECLLQGLFGIDGIYRDGTFWPVEINPRYTASIEVLECALGWPMLGWHGHVFTHGALPVLPHAIGSTSRLVGKAILFARETLIFPAEGPWMRVLRSSVPIEGMPAFADIPNVGERIEAARPILTLFATAQTVEGCEDALRQVALDLDRWLFSR